MADATPVQNPTPTPAAPAPAPAPAPEPNEGFLHSLATSIGIDPEAVVATAKAIRSNPLQAAKEIGGAQADEFVDAAQHPVKTARLALKGVISSITNPEAQAAAKARFNEPGFMNKLQGAEEYVTSGLPMVGGGIAKSEEQAGKGNLAGAAGTLTGTVGPLLTDTEGAQNIKAHLAETGKNFVDEAKAGLQRAAEATAPEGSLEAGFAKLGGKKVGNTPQPLYHVDPEALASVGGKYVGKTPSGVESQWVNNAQWEENPHTGYRKLILRDDSGKQIGVIAHDNYRIRLSDLSDQYTNKGIGKAIYERAFEDAKQNGAKELMSDTSLSPDAARVWDSLAKSGKYNITAEPSTEVNRGKVGNVFDNLHTQYTVHFDEPIGKTPEPPAPTAPAAAAPEYHPDLQKITELPGVEVHRDPTKIVNLSRGSFIAPDGQIITLPPGMDHDKAIQKVNPDRPSGDAEDNRIKFLNDAQTIRVRPAKDAGGLTLHVNVPKNGVTPEQVSTLRQAVGQGLGREGQMIMATAEKPGTEKSAFQDFVKPSQVDDMLKEIGAHPDQAAAKATTVPDFIANAPVGVLKQDAPAAAPVKKFVEDNGGVFRGMQVDKVKGKNVGLVYFDVPPERVGGKTDVTASVPLDKATPEGIKAAVDAMAEQHQPKVSPNPELQASAQKYAAAHDMAPINHEPVTANPERATEIAKIYDEAKHSPNDPRVKAAYDALKSETMAQFHHLRDDLGLKFEPQKEDPYKSAGEMMNDIKKNNRLKVYSTADELPADHPLSEIAPGTGGNTYNTVFRWVHDALGHAAGGNDFSENGEKSATEAHAQMYSDTARPAMRAETEGQTSWFFHNPEVEAGRAKPGQFAEQKATILPDVSHDWHETAGRMAAKNEAGGINPRTGKSDKTGLATEILQESRQPLNHVPTPADFQAFYDKNKVLFDKYPELRVGWDNKSAVPGGHEINIGGVGPGAVEVAKKLDQKSAFDIAKGKIIPTGGTGLKTKFKNYPIEDRIADLKTPPPTTPSTSGTGGFKDMVPQGPLGNRISSRFPTAVRATENPMNHDLTLSSSMILQQPKIAERLADKVVAQNKSMVFTPEDLKTPKGIFDAFERQAMDNIKAVYYHALPANRITNRVWYDGAHEIGVKDAQANGLEPRQNWAAIATQSPQKDWNQNVSLYERLSDAVLNKSDVSFTPKMEAKAKEFISEIRAANNKKVAAGKAPTTPWVDNKLIKSLKGKSISEISDPAEKAAFVRLYDEAHNPREFHEILPDGTKGGIVMLAGTNTPEKVAWGGLNSIAKGISVLQDGSLENISRNLGEAHKVRSFYNNIAEPLSAHEDVTADTHHVGLSLMRPVAGDDPETLLNFGGNGSTITGVHGTYPLYVEATRKAMREINAENPNDPPLQYPRQLQSVVWVEWREMFPPESRTPQTKAAVDSIWKEHLDGKITADEARKQVFDYADKLRARMDEKKQSAANQGELSQHQLPGTGNSRGSGGGPTEGTPAVDEGDTSFDFGANVKSKPVSEASKAKTKKQAQGIINMMQSLKKPGANAPIPTKLKQTKAAADNMNDPTTRAAAARHEAGHAVISEMLEPGSVNSTGLTAGGGVTDIQPPAGKTTVGQLSPDEVRDMIATSYAGGLSEPNGTTAKHVSGDVAERAQVLGSAPSSLWQGIQRLATSRTNTNDPMLQNNQTQAEARARVTALLADPKIQQQIDNIASHITAKGKLSGDEVRALLNPATLTASK